MRKEIVFVVGRNAAGASDILEVTVNVSQKDYDNDKHFDLAKDVAKDLDFEAPLRVF